MARAGCVWCVIILVILGCCGVGAWWVWPRRSQVPSVDYPEPDLRQFAKDQVPELQLALEQIEHEIADRTDKCDKLELELKRLRRDPNADSDLKRWRTAVTEMKEHLQTLRKQREEAYLAYKKYELAPANTKTKYERVRAKALQAAVESQAYHKKMQERIEGTN